MANPEWHTWAMTEDDLRQAADAFRDAPRLAAERRDAVIRQAKADGWRVMDITRATGFSRETIRLALRRGEQQD
jgi:transcriptional regulator of acetoin/glycerol metabolism